MTSKVRERGEMRAVLFLLLLCAALGIGAKDWQGTDCGISLSYDDSIWEVLPAIQGADFALKAEGYFDDEGEYPYYDMFLLSCRSNPGSELTDELRQNLAATFKREGGTVLDQGDWNLAGAPGYVVYGKRVIQNQPSFESRMLVVLKDRFVLMTVMTPTDSEYQDDLGHPSFDDIMDSIRFAGFEPPPPPPLKTIESKDWGMAGLVSLAPQKGWGLIKQEKDFSVFATDDAQNVVQLSYMDWRDDWTPKPGDMFDNFEGTWNTLLFGGSYGSWDKTGTLQVDGAALKWKGGFEYGDGTSPEKAKTRRKTFYKRTRNGVIWIRLQEAGGWQDTLRGEALVKLLRWLE